MAIDVKDMASKQERALKIVLSVMCDVGGEGRSKIYIYYDW
jgi:hypothetical protein